jgi:histidinol-phosphate aminotransferase
MFNLDSIVRENIKNLAPYSCARDEFKGEARVFLDANENSYGSAIEPKLHRYPDPLQMELKTLVSERKSVAVENIFVGNGSDEAIDLVFRIFCRPGIDNIISIAPSYGMYKVCANVNDIEYREALLNTDYSLNIENIVSRVDDNTKAIFLCSPNNPTGNILNHEKIGELAGEFNGLIIIDEAYIDFANSESFVNKIGSMDNVIVLQTFSKAWGLANLRVGMAFSNPAVIELFNRAKMPYNVNGESQRLAIEALKNYSQYDDKLNKLIEQRRYLENELSKVKGVEKIYKSEANFILIKVKNATNLYTKLSTQGIVVRNRTTQVLCENCIRITVGTEVENRDLLEVVKDILN